MSVLLRRRSVYLKILGLHEHEIRAIEATAGTAEEEREPVTKFVRKLAEADPRPGKQELDDLRASGFSPLAISEIIGVVTAANFSNRNCTFLAAPPEAHLEHLADTFMARLFRLIWGKKNGAIKPRKDDLVLEENQDSFSPFVDLLRGTAYARWLRCAIDGCLASESVPIDTKLMMFGVIGRTIRCLSFEQACESALTERGWSVPEIHEGLDSLAPHRLPRESAAMLSWTRDTVWYVPFEVQQKTARLAKDLDDPKVVVDAIGTAALGNALVRLGLLL